MLAKIPGWIKKVYPQRCWSIPVTEKKLYLTFDDGPIPEITPWVLEQLKTVQARATFFCIGDNIRKHPEVFQQLLKEEHQIGNHSFHHLNGWNTNTSEYLEDIRQTQALIEQESKHGVAPKLFRPPYGRMSGKQARILREKGFQIVMWDVLSMDYNSKLSSEKCLQNILKNAKPGSIIIFHDSLKATKNLKIILPEVLRYFDKKGYRFEEIPF